MSDWQPIETAPKDGSVIDAWCVPPKDTEFVPEGGGIRLADISWHDADAIFPHTGWVRLCDNGDWDLLEGEPTCEYGLPPWIATHWMPLPAPPK